MAIRYRTFANARRSALDTASSVAMTPRGPIEYVDVGTPEATPILFFHGSPGGYDQLRTIGPLPELGYRVISWSRPGYLRTPLSAGSTFAEQSDAAAAMLDELNVGAAIAYGVSGGGPSAIEFARRHPGTTRGLVLDAALSRHYAPEINPVARAVFLSGRGTRISGWFARRFPRLVLSDFLRNESTLDRTERAEQVAWILADPDRRRIFEDLMASLTPFEDRAAGLDNDLAQFSKVDDTLTEGVRCPTLVLHGSHDGDVDLTHPRHAAATIPDAQLHIVDKGWHLLTLSTGGDDAMAAKRAFFSSVGVVSKERSA